MNSKGQTSVEIERVPCNRVYEGCETDFIETTDFIAVALSKYAAHRRRQDFGYMH